MRRQTSSRRHSSDFFLLSVPQAFQAALSLILLLVSIGWIPLLSTEKTPNVHRRDAQSATVDSLFSYLCVIGARADELGNSTNAANDTTTTDGGGIVSNTTSEETPTITTTTQTQTTSTSTPTTSVPSTSSTTSTSTTAQAPSTSTTASTTASSPASTSTSGTTSPSTAPTSSASGSTISTSASSTTVTNTPNPTNTPTATTSSVAPEALTKASSLNPAVVGISVVVLVVLFTLSFYFIVMWPRTAMRKYRRSFESHDGKDGKEVKIYQLKSKASGGGGGGGGEDGEYGAYLPPPTGGASDYTHVADTLYGGAPLKRKAGDGALSKIPTFKDIEAAAAGGADYREL